MHELTKLNLYRSCRIEQFPNGVMENLTPSVGLLDPDFYEKPLEGGGARAADVDINVIDGIEWVLSGGGTSLFDRAGVFTKPGWLSFEIPDGTPIPESLAIVNTGYNKRFKATHYQIESKAGRMRKDSMQGALDNLARSAIARSIELSRQR